MVQYSVRILKETMNAILAKKLVTIELTTVNRDKVALTERLVSSATCQSKDRTRVGRVWECIAGENI